MNLDNSQRNQNIYLSRELFLFCYRDEYDSLVVAIKKVLKKNDENAAVVAKTAIKCCPEDAWLPMRKFDILEQNEKCAWANQVDTHGRTLLHYCCASKQELAPLAARYLLDAKASLLICDADGKYPVHYLARNGNVLMFERCPEFLKVVAQKTRNHQAQTPYDVAKSKGHIGFTTFLLAKCPWVSFMQKKEKKKKEDQHDSRRDSPTPDWIRSRRPSSARSSDYNVHTPTSSKRNSLKSDDSDERSFNDDFGVDELIECSTERLPTVPSMENLLEHAQKVQSDVDELYRIASEFSNWNPVISKSLVLRWSSNYVYSRGSSLDIILRPHCGHAAIHLAVINGCTDGMIVLLKLGASTNVQNDEGYTPLHLACMLGFPTVVHELLKVGADVHRHDTQGRIPVELVPNDYKGIQITMLMFRFASSLSIDDGDRNQSLLESMIEKQHFEMVDFLLSMRPWSAFHINDRGETLLHCVAKVPYDSKAIITAKILISLGIDAQHKNSNGLSALEVCSDLYSPLSSFLSNLLAIHIQRMQGIYHLVKLTELGYWSQQKVFEVSSKKLSPMDKNSAKEMTFRGSQDSIKHLHKIDSDCNNLLHRACSIGATSLAQKLLNGGLAGQPQNLNGDTPLHVAAFNGRNEIILCLFAVSFTKALIHATNKHGFRAFDLASYQGHVPVLATFLSWGYTEKFDKTSPKSLFAAVAGKRWNAISFLLEHLPRESKFCSDKDDNNYLHHLAALNSQESIEFFKQIPMPKLKNVFERRCLRKKNIMNLDPFELAGKNHNITFLSFFRKYCATCIVCSAKQFLARRQLQQLEQNAAVQVSGIWKVKGYSLAVTKRFALWTALGAIVDIWDDAVFVKKVLPNGVAHLMNLREGCAITAIWDLHTCDFNIVKISTQSHPGLMHLNDKLAMKLENQNDPPKSLEANETHDNAFQMENGDVVRLHEHNYKTVENANILSFAATQNNRLSSPFNFQKLMKMDGPHMIVKIVSLTGVNICQESQILIRNVISRSELQLNFHPESDEMSNLLFAPLENVKNAIKKKPVSSRKKSVKIGAFDDAQEKAELLAIEALKDSRSDVDNIEDLFFGTVDGDSSDIKEILYRPDIELFETVEKLDVDVVLPCTVVAAVSQNCLCLGQEKLQAGDQIIAIDSHRTINLKTAQGFLEGKKDTLVTITVARAKSKSAESKVDIILSKLARTTPNTWLSWVESTMLVQNLEEKKHVQTKLPETEDSFAAKMCSQQLASCEMVAGRATIQELCVLQNVPWKNMRHRLGACRTRYSMITTAADQIKAVYKAHLIRRAVVCNFTLRQSLQEKSKITERILITNGIATQMVVEWVNNGLLGITPLQYCIEIGHSDGLLQLIHYGFGTQTSWCDDIRSSQTFYSLMDSALDNKASKASLVLVQELGLLAVLENSSYSQTDKAQFVLNASIVHSCVDVLNILIENPSVMQCVGEYRLQSALTLAVQYGRVDIVHAILQARPRMTCIRLISFPNTSVLQFVLKITKLNTSECAQHNSVTSSLPHSMCRNTRSLPHQLCYDFASISMLFSFAKFGCVLFSENEDLNPLKSYLPPQLIEVLQNFVEFREAEVLKAIANGLAVRCRKRKEEKLIQELKMLHEARQEEAKKVNIAKKQHAWSKVGSKQEMIALALNFRRIAIGSNMERQLEKLDQDSQAVQAQSTLDLERELSNSASRLRMEGKTVQQIQSKNDEQ